MLVNLADLAHLCDCHHIAVGRIEAGRHVDVLRHIGGLVNAIEDMEVESGHMERVSGRERRHSSELAYIGFVDCSLDVVAHSLGLEEDCYSLV